MVDSVLPNEGCEVFDVEMNDEEWDKNGNQKMLLIVMTHTNMGLEIYKHRDK